MTVNPLRTRRLAAAATLLALATSAPAQEAAAPAAPAPSPVGAAAPKAEEKSAIKVGAFVHVDGRLFLDDDDALLTDDLLIRRARADFQGKLGPFAGRLVLDVGGGKAVLVDGYVDAKLPLDFKIRFGKQTPPLGLERIHSSNGTVFVENALPQNLSPSRDVGLLLIRDFGKLATVSAGVFDGAADGASPDADVSDDKDVVARVLVRPFALAGIDLLSDLAVGVAGSYGATHGAPKATDLGSFKSDGQATIFDYKKNSTAPGVTDTAFASGRRTRLVAHGQWYAGPVVLLGEYVASQQRILFNGQSARPRHTAWQATAAYAITGEKSSEAGLVPSSPVDRGGLGAFMVKARVAALDVDDDVFPVFADPAKTVSRATSFGAGLTWWATSTVRIELDYCQTAFEGGASSADRPTEKAILSRFQVVL